MPSVFACLLLASVGAEPGLEPGFHRGVNHAHIHREDRGYGSDVSAAELAALGELGVSWVALTPFGYQRTFDAPMLAGYDPAAGRFTPRDRSMPDSALIAEVDAAHALGIKVALKPHVWSNDFWQGEQWHGSVNQNSAAEHDTWWRSYRAMILHYAELAEQAGVDMYVIGTELVEMSLRYPDEWRTLITDVRKIYRGPLTYAAHWDREYSSIVFWDDLDYIGINAYFPLETGPDADVEALVAAWGPHRQAIEAVQTKWDKPALFLEAGYRPVADTHARPWEHRGGEPDPSAQALAYEALFRAFADADWWAGLYLWKTFTDPRGGRRRGTSFAFRDRPAQEVVTRWYNGTPQRQ